MSIPKAYNPAYECAHDEREAIRQVVIAGSLGGGETPWGCYSPRRVAWERFVRVVVSDQVGRGNSKPPHLVYFLRHPNGRIKVGCTSNFRRRLYALRYETHSCLEVIGTIRGSLSKEAEILGDLGAYRVNGEWVKDVPEVNRYIEATLRGAEVTALPGRSL